MINIKMTSVVEEGGGIMGAFFVNLSAVFSS